MTSPTPELDKLIQAEPDLVDRLFDFMMIELGKKIGESLDRMPPEEKRAVKLAVKRATHAEFKGEQCYVAALPAADREERDAAIRAMFTGGNQKAVLRHFRISKSTLGRIIARARIAKKESQIS